MNTSAYSLIPAHQKPVRVPTSPRCGFALPPPIGLHRSVSRAFQIMRKALIRGDNGQTPAHINELKPHVHIDTLGGARGPTPYGMRN